MCPKEGWWALVTSEDKYQAQKKYLKNKKKLSVWIDPEKHEKFKAAAVANGTTVYALIHAFVDDYLGEGTSP